MTQRFRAVLFDVDGTLYLQSRLRILMAFELCLSPIILRSWRKALRTVHILRSFRRVRETLRQQEKPGECLLEEWQFLLTAEKSGIPADEIRAVVGEWMYQRPLKYLKYCRRKGLEQFLAFATAQQLAIGVFSDYPAREKIEAMKLSPWVKLVLCATDKNIDALKPHPQGFLRACEEWNLRPEEVLYIGDRVEVDGEGAMAAGMSCMILDGTLPDWDTVSDKKRPLGVKSFQGIQHALTTHC